MPFDPPPFEPHPLLVNGHAMTIAGAAPRRVPRNVVQGEELRRFQVEDDVFLSARCNWLENREERTTVVIVHGLTGDARSSYAYGTAEKALAAGMNAVRLDLRGCGESEAASPTIYHAGVSADLGAVVRELRGRDGLERLCVVGFSLGGNVALKLAGELGPRAAEWLAGIVSISAPIDLALCSDELDRRGLNRVYQRCFLRDLSAKLAHKHAAHPQRFPIDGLARVRSMREFDDRFTGPLGGFGDAATYYARCSSLPLLSNVAVPTLLVHARDDCFVPFASYVTAGLEAHPWIRLLAPAHGGHNAFLARGSGEARGAGGWRERGRFWAENRAIQFAAALGKNRSTGKAFRPVP